MGSTSIVIGSAVGELITVEGWTVFVLDLCIVCGEKRNEFAIHNHNFDFEITCSIRNSLHMLGRQDKLFEFAICNMRGGGKLDMVTDVSKNRGLVDEEYVSQKSHVLVGRQD